MPLKTPPRECLLCHKPVHGRSDKKFCNDYCRNAYNNARHSHHYNAVRNITNALVRNRRIMDTILSNEKTVKTTRETLALHGFNFRYMTHIISNRNGDKYCFCFDVGYLPLDTEVYLLVRRIEERL